MNKHTTAAKKHTTKQHIPLNVTQAARHRIFVGLGWDPVDKASLIEKAKSLVGGPKVWHDLDLSCYMYDQDKVFIDAVTAKDGKHIDQTGNIYHSGDNIEGVGDGDDEQISVELKDLDTKIHHIVFIATINSGHTFGDIKAPEIRLADGYSGREFLKTGLDAADGREKSGFIFAHIYRKDPEPHDSSGSAWALHHINQFMPGRDIQEWPALIAMHLDIQN